MRRGPLPSAIAEMLGAILEQGPAAPELGGQPAPGDAEPASSGDGGRNPQAGSAPFGIAIPAPRTAAAAILAMLGFGVVLGSFANANVESLARSVLVAVSPPPVTAPASTVADTGSSATSGSSGGGSSPSSAGAPSAAAPSAASTPIQTQTTPSTGGGGSPASGGSGLPSVKHVFLIVLSDQGLNQTFGLASHDHYLAKTLPAQGELVQSYYAVAGSALANEVALISGQGPTVQTTANCPQFTAVTPASKGAQGQILGDGCVYPLGTLTLGDELVANGQTWKAYIQGIGNVAPGQPTTCRHPQLGATDADHVPRPGDPYVTWRNPFVYFSSIINTGACNGSDVDLEQLATDLQSEAKTPTMSYIVPSACDDGTELACVAGAKSGLASADGFLQGIVPQIEQSAAYKDHGLIAVTFDEAPQSGPNADASSCCNQPTYPNLPPASSATTGTVTTAAAAFLLAGDPATGTTTTAGTPTDSGTTTSTTTTTRTSTSSVTTTSAPTTTTTSETIAPTTTSTTAAPTSTAPATTTTPSTTTTTTPTATGTGGGQVGLVLISPLIKPRTKDLVDQVNHYSLLATLADLFGVARLGYSKDAIAFDSSVFNASP
jgi:phosphatidylinositol-3-phosphatase